MNLTLLLDTSVWVDNYCTDHAACKATRRLIDTAFTQGCSLVYPAGIIKDVFCVLEHEFRRVAMREARAFSEEDALTIRQAAWECINNMCEVATAVGADEGDVWLARKRKSLTDNLESNLILVAAQRAGADFIVTRNRALILHATTATLTPADMLKVLEAQG